MSVKLQHTSYRKDRKRGNRPVIDTLMLMKGNTQIYIQSGNVFNASGNNIPLANVPDWVKAELTQTSKDRLASLGFQLKAGRVTPSPAKEVEKGPARSAPVVEEDDD